MGAYFQTQLVQDDELKMVKRQSWLKFLETFYFLNPEHNTLYHILAKHATQKNPVKVYTVCDYDEAENNSKPIRPYVYDGDEDFSENPFDDIAPIENMQDRIMTGFLICPDRNEYLDLSAVSVKAKTRYDQGKSTLISPLALLTRLHTERMGGGDYGFNDCDEEQLNTMGSWYGKDIYYTQAFDILLMLDHKDVTDLVAIAK